MSKTEADAEKVIARAEEGANGGGDASLHAQLAPLLTGVDAELRRGGTGLASSRQQKGDPEVRRKIEKYSRKLEMAEQHSRLLQQRDGERRAAALRSMGVEQCSDAEVRLGLWFQRPEGRLMAKLHPDRVHVDACNKRVD
eukprot:gene38329-38739_t